jgi:hypothetical protein
MDFPDHAIEDSKEKILKYFCDLSTLDKCKAKALVGTIVTEFIDRTEKNSFLELQIFFAGVNFLKARNEGLCEDLNNGSD